MIKLPARPKCPVVLKSKKVKNAHRALTRKVAEGKKLSSADFMGKSYWGETKEVLHQYQNGKCCFCERRRDAKAEADVEHFRPRLKVTENPGHSGYWWLAYKWSNLLFSCKLCNSGHKKNRFPMVRNDETCRAATKDHDLSFERPVLINPSLEDPADFIEYDWGSDPSKIFPIGRDPDGRGMQTINILGLATREELHKGRADLLRTLRFAERVVQESMPGQQLYRDAIQQLRRKTDPNQEYLGLAYYYIRCQGLVGLLDD